MTIGYDTTKGGRHAFDYLTSYNRTETLADPCAGLTCTGGSDPYAIPSDTQLVTGAPHNVTQAAGDMTLFGGDITNVVYDGGNGLGSYPSGDTSRFIKVRSRSQAPRTAPPCSRGALTSRPVATGATVTPPWPSPVPVSHLL